jgi:hypothetical protein
MNSDNRYNIVTVATTVASTSMISMLARPIWTTFNTKTRRYARSCKSTSARFKSRSRRGRSKRRGQSLPSLQATYIIWYPPRQSQEFTILHSLTWSLRRKCLVELHLKSTFKVNYQWKPFNKDMIKFSGLCRWSSKKRRSSRNTQSKIV